MGHTSWLRPVLGRGAGRDARHSRKVYGARRPRVRRECDRVVNVEDTSTGAEHIWTVEESNGGGVGDA